MNPVTLPTGGAYQFGKAGHAPLCECVCLSGEHPSVVPGHDLHKRLLHIFPSLQKAFRVRGTGILHMAFDQRLNEREILFELEGSDIDQAEVAPAS